MSFIDVLWGLAGFLESIASFLWGFITGIWSLITTVFSIVIDVISFLPPAWSAIIIAGLFIVGAYSIHRWIKHISIAGNKV
ncbi:Uncharacterised protein [uncultured archaeon]|nr:Uncharacterised protein [uncultured archaeon]